MKGTDLQAAIGCAQLEKLAGFTEKRQENYRKLRDGLKDLKELTVFECLPESEPSWFGLLMTVSDDAGFTRNDLTGYLEADLIQTRNLFAGNILKHPCFETLVEGTDYRVSGTLENTEKIMNNSFWIGLYPGLGEAKLEYMISKIRECCRK